MFRRTAGSAILCVLAVAGLSAQAKKPATSKPIVHEVTITADNVYTGTMEMSIVTGKVSGTMLLTSPTEITGKIAGTSKAGELDLEFPFHMTGEQLRRHGQDDHRVARLAGAVEGDDGGGGLRPRRSNKVTGTVELKPVPAAAPAKAGGRGGRTPDAR